MFPYTRKTLLGNHKLKHVILWISMLVRSAKFSKSLFHMGDFIILTILSDS